MNASSSKLLFFLVTAALYAGTAVLSSTGGGIVIESVESKTQEGHPVFNRIELDSTDEQDTWTMHQSHGGRKLPDGQWDQIRIIVNKTKRPYLVRFQQINQGKEVELKAACFTCHANGPRAIRPKFDSAQAPLSPKDRFRIVEWNMRMKFYGKVKVDPQTYLLEGNFREMPFRFAGKKDVEVLKVKTCTQCHNADTFWGRGELQRQHASTISHLVKSGAMPPWPFTLSDKEKREVKKFVRAL